MKRKLEGLLTRTTLEVARISVRHFEWREMSRTHFSDPGRMWRAKLALQASLDLNLSEDTAVQIAVACELAHNASLVQDDWMDTDTQRRGNPAVWAKFGAPAAILFSDYLLNASYAALNRVSATPQQKSLATALFARRIQQAAGGQLRELQSVVLQREDYLLATRLKTGLLLAMPVELALAVCGAWRAHGSPVRRGLEIVGQAYQLVDDLNDGTPTYGFNFEDAAFLCDEANKHFRRAPSPLAQTLFGAALRVRDLAVDLSHCAAA